MQGDKVLARQTGAAPEATLRAWLEEVLTRSGATTTTAV